MQKLYGIEISENLHKIIEQYNYIWLNLDDRHLEIEFAEEEFNDLEDEVKEEWLAFLAEFLDQNVNSISGITIYSIGDDRTYEVFSGKLSKSEHVKTLSLDFRKRHYEYDRGYNVDTFIKFIEDFKTVDKINLNDISYVAGNGELGKLCKKLQSKSITSLSISEGNFDKEGAKLISGLLIKNGNLKNLDISSNFDKDKPDMDDFPDAWRLIADALKANQSLTSLKISDNITAKIYHLEWLENIIADIIANNSTLNTFDFSELELTSRGLKIISEALQKNSSIINIGDKENFSVLATEAEILQKIPKYEGRITEADSSKSNLLLYFIGKKLSEKFDPGVKKIIKTGNTQLPINFKLVDVLKARSSFSEKDAEDKELIMLGYKELYNRFGDSLFLNCNNNDLSESKKIKEKVEENPFSEFSNNIMSTKNLVSAIGKAEYLKNEEASLDWNKKTEEIFGIKIDFFNNTMYGMKLMGYYYYGIKILREVFPEIDFEIDVILTKKEEIINHFDCLSSPSGAEKIGNEYFKHDEVKKAKDKIVNACFEQLENIFQSLTQERQAKRPREDGDSSDESSLKKQKIDEIIEETLFENFSDHEEVLSQIVEGAINITENYYEDFSW